MIIFLWFILVIEGDNLKILITGARNGIGYETGIKLAKFGHKVILSVHKEEQLPLLKEKVEKLNLSNISLIVLDITKEYDRKKIITLDIDCLINNASIGIGGSILDLSIDKIKENFEVNVFSTIKLSQIYAGHLFLTKKKGKIIFISSLASIIPIPFLGAYSATKAALTNLAIALKSELKLITKDIQVKLIEPGIYYTGFNEVMLENKLDINNSYFPNLEDITLKQKKLFKLISSNNLNSITSKIVLSCLDDSNKFLYKAPFKQSIIAKLYMLIFK